MSERDGGSHKPCVYVRNNGREETFFKNRIGNRKSKKRGRQEERNGEIKRGKEPTGMLTPS